MPKELKLGDKFEWDLAKDVVADPPEPEPGDEAASENSCWSCKHLISAPLSTPPLFCKAFPDGSGIPMNIIMGWVHSFLLGSEKTPVKYEPISKAAYDKRMASIAPAASAPDLRDPKRKRLLIKTIFAGSEALYTEFLELYDAAVARGSGIPFEAAMVEFRKKYSERPDGTWAKI